MYIYIINILLSDEENTVKFLTSNFVLLKKGKVTILSYGILASYFLAGVIEYEQVDFNIKI